MSVNVSVFEPIAPHRTGATQKRHVLNSLKGKVVGFVDNTKPNFNHLVEDLAELLISTYGVKSIIKHSKPSVGVPASEEVMKDLAERCDLVITGSGD